MHDSEGILEELGGAKRTPATTLVQERTGYVALDKLKNLATRCATCGPLAAVAGYAVEHRAIVGPRLEYSMLKRELELEAGTLQDADLFNTETNWTWSTDYRDQPYTRRRLAYSRSEQTLRARHMGASSSSGWNQGYQGQSYQGGHESRPRW